MSLDVYLTTPKLVKRGSSGIFVRENGETKEISRAEWDDRNPGHEPCVVCSAEETYEVYSRNITHNLNDMAEDAGIYKHLWRPDEIDITKAAQLIKPLKEGLARLKAEPKRFKKFNPSNGWGDYDGLVDFVKDYLAACEANPEANVSVWR